MTVRYYRWDDANAPVITDTAGGLINLLDKCLVTGYGSKTAAGWSKPFTGTNLAAFRTGAGSNQFYLRVDDTSTQVARLVGYETMTNVSTGTGLFPTAAQVSGGAYVYRSDGNASGVARPWVMVATAKIFHLWIAAEIVNASPTYSYSSDIVTFGDFVSYKTADTYNTILRCSSNAGAGGNKGFVLSTSVSDGGTGAAIARKYDQLGTAVLANLHSDNVRGTTTMGGGVLFFPALTNGGLYLAPLGVNEQHSSPFYVRGELPGLWNPCHVKPLSHLDTFTGTGTLAGREFLAVNGWSNSQAFLEISNTWAY